MAAGMLDSDEEADKAAAKVHAVILKLDRPYMLPR